MRKHHNRLYFGKYTHKATFKVPNINILYPTTDYYLDRLMKKENLDISLQSTIKFIKANRKNMKFRIQNRSCIFYANKELILNAIDSLWRHWIGINSIDIKQNKIYDKKTVVCKRLPLGKYQYQIHTKRTRTFISVFDTKFRQCNNHKQKFKTMVEWSRCYTL